MLKESARPVNRTRAIVGLLAVALTGCGDVCTDEAHTGLVVIVTDGEGGPALCNATVTVRDGAFSEVLTAFDDAPDCTYAGVHERPGIYRVTVMAGARSKTVDGVEVTQGECHVNGRTVTVALDR